LRHSEVNSRQDINNKVPSLERRSLAATSNRPQ